MAQELKAYDFPVDHGDFTATVELFYLKSEADKLIEELKAIRKRLEEANTNLEKRNDSIYNEWKVLFEKSRELKKQVHDYAQGLYVMQAKAENEARRHKYKRCLAMSECREAQARWCYQAANTLPPGVTATLNGKYVMVEPRRLFIRSGRLLLASTLWKQRAEKFKEANDGND